MSDGDIGYDYDCSIDYVNDLHNAKIESVNR